MSRSFGGRSLTTRSPIVISPAVISSRPATILRVVDLPHPEGPTRTMNSLSRIWRFTSLTACTSSYFLFRSFIITCAMTVSPLAFHRARQAGDIVLDKEGINEGHRDRPQKGTRHELAPEVDVPADQLGHHTDRHRLALGKMIRVIAPNRVAPSMRAHSSSSLGIVLKYPMRSHVQNGIRNVG